MAVYTVHEPPTRTEDGLGHAERFAFVRDGFSWPAFLVSPIWMLGHRLWLVLVGYLGLAAALVGVLRLIGASDALGLVLGLLSLLVGFEASSLRRWTLARRGWINLGVVVGDDLEAAERRFFDAWVAGGPLQAPRQSPSRPASPPGRTLPEVIGLFPEPGTPS